MSALTTDDLGAGPDPEDGDRLGPVEMLVVEFPGGVLGGAGFATLTDLIDRGTIAVLDLEFVRRSPDGEVALVDVADAVAGATTDLGYLVGSSSGLLDLDDVSAVGDLIEPGSLACVVLFEHLWIIPLVDAVEVDGGRIVAAAHVDPEELVSAVDHLDHETES